MNKEHYVNIESESTTDAPAEYTQEQQRHAVAVAKLKRQIAEIMKELNEERFDAAMGAIDDK